MKYGIRKTILMLGSALTILGFSLVAHADKPADDLNVVPSCSAIKALDETGITCPKKKEGRVLICSMELDKPFFGLNKGTSNCCVCDTDAPKSNQASRNPKQCNPNVPAGGKNACTKADSGKAVEVSTIMEFNNDPYYCTTTGGTRTCFSY